MKVAFLSDVHGNEIALDTCLAVIQRLRVDQIQFLGDAVGYMPGEIPVLARLKEEGIPCQQGNHEAMLLGERPPDEVQDAIYRLTPARARLIATPAWLQIQAWPTRVTREYGGRRFLLVHGSPSDELFGYVHQNTDLAPFCSEPADVIVMSNTHRPWIREAGGKIFVNTGSAGLPRDHGALAAFAVCDADTGVLRIIRVPIDVGEIKHRYGNEIAPEVIQCFARKSDHPVGEVVQ